MRERSREYEKGMMLDWGRGGEKRERRAGEGNRH